MPNRPIGVRFGFVFQGRPFIFNKLLASFVNKTSSQSGRPFKTPTLPHFEELLRLIKRMSGESAGANNSWEGLEERVTKQWYLELFSAAERYA